jgi:hypothetical protein
MRKFRSAGNNSTVDSVIAPNGLGAFAEAIEFFGRTIEEAIVRA